MKRDKKFRQKQPMNQGNLINRILGNNDILPEVGKGATELQYVDRHAYEVIEVSKDFKTVKLEALNARVHPDYLAKMAGKPIAGHQEWLLEPSGRFCTVVWKWGKWRFKGKTIEFTKEFSEKAKKEGNEYARYKSLTPEQYKEVYGNDIRPSKVVEGITVERPTYSEVNLIFGRKDHYYCWEF